jgi:hypothetical protein
MLSAQHFSFKYLTDSDMTNYKIQHNKFNKKMKQNLKYNTMKTLIKTQFISLAAIIATFLGITSCVDNKFDFPIENLYNHGLTANINIADLKAKYLNSTVEITQDLIVAGNVCSNDKEGNIFKTLYIQDETGGLPIVIDQSNISNNYRTGRKVLVKLKGLYLGSYSGLIQLGMAPETGEASPSRIPATLVSEYIVKDYEVKDIEPETVSIPQLANRDDLIGKLIRINDVQFTDPNATYATADANTNRAIEDKDGNTVILRNSSYATFALLPMPIGSGSVTAVLSVYVTGSAKTFQLLVRDTADVAFYNPRFGNGGGTGTGEVILRETFGNAVTGSPWPSVAAYAGYLKEGKGAAAVTYTAEVGVSVRNNANSSAYSGASGECNAMMAAAGASLLVNDIATCGARNLTLTFGSNETNTTLSVAYKINGTTTWTPVTYTKTDATWGLVSATITLPAGANTIKLKFTAAATQYGTRIDDVKITTEDPTSAPIIDPDEDGGGGTGNDEIFKETCGTEAPPSSPRPTPSQWTGWDNGAPITFDGTSDVRSTGSMNTHVWFAAASDRTLIISGINTSGKTNLKLSFDVASNANDQPVTANANAFFITVKDLVTNTESSITVPSTSIPAQNTYITVSGLTGIPETGNLQITFYTTAASNPANYGYRLDNIVIYE